MANWFEAARLRAGQILRERKERIAEKRAARQQGGGHDSRFWLLSIPATATLCAAFVEVYWATLFCIEATGSLTGSWATALGSGQPAHGAWTFQFDIRNVFVLIGLICATIPIVMWSMVWLPVQMKARGHGRWRRTTMIVAGLLANALVIVSGTVVMNSNRQDQVRAELVTEQSADQGRAALVAQRNAIHDRWATLTAPSNTTLQAQAARAGTAGWDSYIATARQQLAAGTISQARFDLIERARGSAVAAEAYQQQMDAMTGRIAASAPVAATQAVVQDNVGVGLNTFAQYATVYRPPFVALICTIIGIFGAWWWVGLAEAMDRHNVSLSGWADEGHRIEDLREDEAIVPQPMKPAREVVTDAETGEELIRVTPKPHWRKRKPQKVNIAPDAPPDETGVTQDGGKRIAMKGEHEPVSQTDASEPLDAVTQQERATDPPQEPSANAGEMNGEASAAQLEGNLHPEISDEAAEAYAAANEDGAGEQAHQEQVAEEMSVHFSPPSDAVSEPAEQAAAPDEEQESADDSGVIEDVADDAHARTEPETDPARLIAAE